MEEGDGRAFGQSLALALLTQAQRREFLFLETHALQEVVPQTPAFQKDGEEQVFRLKNITTRVARDIARLFHAVTSMEGQLLDEG
ncbi:MAG: hypothetical protein WDN67_00900 [Candidatus Moraniibacteriota bacterium]